MRVPDYLSPSGLYTWDADREEFARRYLMDERPPRDPQTVPMAIGSAFDAKVKASLYSDLVGGGDATYELEALYTSQVAEPLRDKVRPAMDWLFKCYQQCGAYRRLVQEMRNRLGDVRFEFDLHDYVSTNYGEVPLLGKPDLSCTLSGGGKFIVDWKINGMARNDGSAKLETTSPMQGFCRMWSKKQGSWYLKQHKRCTAISWQGVTANVAITFDQVHDSWCRQLTIYAWLLGAPIGSDFLAGIDQIVGPLTSARVCQHRLSVSPEYQRNLADQIGQIWKRIVDGEIFDDMSVEQSRQMVRDLEDLQHEEGAADGFC